MRTPIFTRLKKYHSENRISFAMPGHKNGRGIDFELLKCDVTELSKTCDLHQRSAEVSASCESVAKHYGSEKSYIVTVGSTACIQAMLSGNLAFGDTVLASADCHMSVVNTCALCGFNLRFIPKSVDGYNVMRKLDPIEPLLEKHPDVKAVIITSPTYYGICEDISSIAKVCHNRGIPLLVDEAHGAHFGACEALPKSAVTLGADAVCQSVHKTLNALTGAAFLHLSGEYINKSRTEAALNMFQTSSPSYVIASSAELAIASSDFEKSWSDICANSAALADKISNTTKIRVLPNDDPTRLVLNFSKYHICGTEVSEILCEKYAIDAEMADRDNIVLIITPSNTLEDLETLYRALCEITETAKQSDVTKRILPPPVKSDVVRPYEAFYGEAREVLLDDSEGMICACNVCAYPPGIPVLVQGMKITKEQILYVNDLIRCNVNVTGMNSGKIKCKL